LLTSPGAIVLQFGPLTIRWYSVLVAVAILVAWRVTDRAARRSGRAACRILDAGEWSIAAGLVGARIYEEIFSWDYYGRYPWRIPAAWEGSLAIYGGHEPGGHVTALVTCRRLLEANHVRDDREEVFVATGEV
jgi:phosphatidylglycerol:prolipoprotein diacylglycerol transferase